MAQRKFCSRCGQPYDGRSGHGPGYCGQTKHTADIDYIKLRPDRIGWTLIVYTEDGVTEYGIGDAIQFAAETERTIGRWLADGPADFHGCDSTEPTSEREAHHGR